MQDKEMKFRVRVNPHNDLGTLAYYHIETVKRKLESNQQDGIALDCTSAVIAMAFYIESLLNYVGVKKFKDEWKERAPYYKKVALLSERLKFAYDKKIEPFRTLEALKDSRDNLAHGKPMEFDTMVNSTRELSKSMRPQWTLVTEPEIVIEAFERAKEFKSMLFTRARIKPGAALTSAFGGG